MHVSEKCTGKISQTEKIFAQDFLDKKTAAICVLPTEKFPAAARGRFFPFLSAMFCGTRSREFFSREFSP